MGDGFLALFGIDGDPDRELDAVKAGLNILTTASSMSRYLDRIYKWVDRVGLDWVKEKVVDDIYNRRALAERFELSQSVYRSDPWAEHAEEKAESYQPLANLTLEAAE